MIRVCPLFSGSRGNSTFIGDETGGILIDVGRSAKQIEFMLRKNEIDISSIKAIFITHEHIDHVNGLKVLASRYSLKVYASEGTIRALHEQGIKDKNFHMEELGMNGIAVCNFVVQPFCTPHDSRQSFAYLIFTKNGQKIVVATDIGVISDEIRHMISGCTVALIESNHDVGMLENSSYPYFVKRRILSDIGHLSNEACAYELPFLVKKGLKKIILGHLSEKNNVPELAYQTALNRLSEHNMILGRDFELFVAPSENLLKKEVLC